MRPFLDVKAQQDPFSTLPATDKGRRLKDILNAQAEHQVAAADELVDALDDLVVRVSDRLVDRLGDTSSTAALEAAALRTELQDVLDLMADEGLADIETAWFQGYQKIADDAEAVLGVMGVPGADRILDREAAASVLDAVVDRHGVSFWARHARDHISINLWDGFVRSATLVSREELAEQLQLAGFPRPDHAVTEAHNAMAEYDRVCHEEAARQAEADGAELLRAYLGPDDNRTRPHCKHLVGKAFTLEQARRLRNRQGRPTLYDGGGHRCRHRWVAVPADSLKELGLIRGTDADIQRANDAARSRNGRRRRRRRAAA